MSLGYVFVFLFLLLVEGKDAQVILAEDDDHTRRHPINRTRQQSPDCNCVEIRRCPLLINRRDWKTAGETCEYGNGRYRKVCCSSSWWTPENTESSIMFDRIIDRSPKPTSDVTTFRPVEGAVIDDISSSIYEEDVHTVSCLNPGSISNGQFLHRQPPSSHNRPNSQPIEVNDAEFPVRSRLHYSCHKGYKMVGRRSLICMKSGAWSAKPPVCRKEIVYCENLGLIQNGRVRNYMWNASVGWSPEYEMDEYPEGILLVYSCDEGYRLAGSDRLECQSTGFWSEKQPECLLDCGRSFMQSTKWASENLDAVSGEWPWVVSISLDDNNDSPFICGGAVINSHTVLTAAHCLEENRPLLLRFGKHKFKVQQDDTEVLTIRSSKVIIHPDYSNRTMDSDIGLIILQQRIRYSYRVQPICLPTPQSAFQNIEPGQVGYVAGWGETEKALPPDTMTLRSLPVVSNQECMDVFREQNLSITENMFCAGYEDVRESVCEGDSGSPFVFYNKKIERYTLVGLVSFGLTGECDVVAKYASFTKVFNFLQWIIKNSK